jgi:hypothetical protein
MGDNSPSTDDQPIATHKLLIYRNYLVSVLQNTSPPKETFSMCTARIKCTAHFKDGKTWASPLQKIQSSLYVKQAAQKLGNFYTSGCIVSKNLHKYHTWLYIPTNSYLQYPLQKIQSSLYVKKNCSGLRWSTVCEWQSVGHPLKANCRQFVRKFVFRQK